MSEWTYKAITDTLLAVTIIVCVVGVAWAVAWAKVQNEPRFQSGFDGTGRPWCQTHDPDTHPCPVFEAPR